MKRSLIVIPLVFLFCITFSCEQDERMLVEPKADVEADIQAIKDVFTEWSAAFNAADVGKILSYYADEVVRIPPNSRPTIGKDTIRASYEQMFNEYTLQGKDVVENVVVSGDLAVAHTTYKYVVTPKNEQDSIETKGNELVVLRKYADSNWKFIYLIWSDEGLVRPTQATVAAAQSPFIGTWKLNLDKSKFIGSAPLEWTDVFREIEDDQYEVTAKTVLADGTIINEVIVWPRQGGVATFIQGGTEGAIEVLSMINPNEMVATRMIDGKQIGLIKILVSQDGKTLRYTIRYSGEIEGEGVFDKQ